MYMTGGKALSESPENLIGRALHGHADARKTRMLHDGEQFVVYKERVHVHALKAGGKPNAGKGLANSHRMVIGSIEDTVNKLDVP
jgi:hypothetical protein